MPFIYSVNHCEHEIAALLTTFVPRNDALCQWGGIEVYDVAIRCLSPARQGSSLRDERKRGVAISWSHLLKLGMGERFWG